MYLENFVESSTFLPPELQRILNTIKSLDERSMELLENIKRNVEAMTSVPLGAGGQQLEEVRAAGPARAWARCQHAARPAGRCAPGPRRAATPRRGTPPTPP